MVSNVNVLGPGVPDIIAAESNGIAIVTIQGNLIEDKAVVISSGSTTTHSNSSLCDSFIFDLSINLFPPADMSDFYEFAYELSHIISLPDVKNLIPIPSESEGVPDNMCDVPFHDNSLPPNVSKDQYKDFSDSNDEFTLTDDDSFSIENIEYVEVSPPDSELVSSEVIEIVIPKVRGIDDDILLTIKDDILREKLLNINLLIANIEALNDNPT
nr:hypothetical protein [Tanacetum cinerariifolium]